MTAAPTHTAPALRFPEFKGEWDVTNLGKLCSITTGKLDANAMVEDGKYRFYTCAKDYYRIDEYAFDTEALLISGNGANVGYIHYYKGKFNAYQRTYVLDKFTAEICYIQQLLNEKLADRISLEKKAGNTPYIVMGTLSDMPISLPPEVGEQQKIAEFLTVVDEKIAQIGEKKTLLERYKKGVMQRLFTQSLRFLDDNGQPFPDWEERKIGKLTNVTAGATPSTFNTEFWGGDIRWMNSGELNLKRVHEVENRITDAGLRNSSTRLIPKHCVLIGLAGQGKTRGTVAMNMVELCTNQSIAAIHPNEGFNSEFLYQELDRRYEELRSLSTGDGGRGGLNLQIIKNLKISFPVISEQQKIADFLTALDQRIAALAAQLSAAQGFKKALLQKMFV